MGKKERDAFNGFVRAMSLLTQLGFTMAACVIIGVFAGKFLDNLFGTSPWLLILFSLLGAGAAIRALYTMTADK